MKKNKENKKPDKTTQLKNDIKNIIEKTDKQNNALGKIMEERENKNNTSL